MRKLDLEGTCEEVTRATRKRILLDVIHHANESARFFKTLVLMRRVVNKKITLIASADVLVLAGGELSRISGLAEFVTARAEPTPSM